MEIFKNIRSLENNADLLNHQVHCVQTSFIHHCFAVLNIFQCKPYIIELYMYGIYYKFIFYGL